MANRIAITHKTDCCGCSTCYTASPKRCIIMATKNIVYSPIRNQVFAYGCEYGVVAVHRYMPVIRKVSFLEFSEPLLHKLCLMNRSSKSQRAFSFKQKIRGSNTEGLDS